MEWVLDGNFTRFALCAVIPLLYCVSLVRIPFLFIILPLNLMTNLEFFPGVGVQFFTLQIVQNVTMMVGPIAHYHKNSKYYSATRPRPNKMVDNNLPHITIQMPVYRESLEAVLCVFVLLSTVLLLIGIAGHHPFAR